MPSCIVKGCNYSWKKKDPSITLHSFPGDLVAIKSWLLALRRATQQEFEDIDELCRKILVGKPKGLYRMCSQHFTVDCYYQRGMLVSLKKEALPSIFPDQETIEWKTLRPKVYRPRQKKVSPPDPCVATFSDTSSSNVPTSMVMDLPLRSIKLEQDDPAPLTTPSLISEQGYYIPHVEVYGQKRMWNSWENRSSRETFPLQKRTRTLGTNTEYFPGQRHKWTLTEKSVGVRHKEVQTENAKPDWLSCACNQNKETGWASDSHLGTRLSPSAMVPQSKTTELVPSRQKAHCRLSGDRSSSDIDSTPEGPTSRRSRDGIHTSQFESFTNGPTVEGEDILLRPGRGLPDSSSWPLKQDVTRDGHVQKPNIKAEDAVEIPAASDLQDTNSENKYVVFDSCLNRLLMYCRCLADDSCDGRIVMFQKFFVGSSVSVKAECSNHHRFHMWDSQPYA